MLILSLDTTSHAGSAAVLWNDEVLAVTAGDGSRPHGERLPGELQAVLDAAQRTLEAVELFVVASGPGAFTALRIGLATVQGMATVGGRPTIGVSALEATACATWCAKDRMNLSELASGARATDPSMACWLDAHRGEVYAALYALSEPDVNGLPWRERHAPSVGRPEDVLASWHGLLDASTVFTGSGAVAHAQRLGHPSTHVTIAPDLQPLAPSLAWIGRRRALRGHAGTPDRLQPLYVRRPDAEIDRDLRAHA